jgi:hypothetical protein
MHVCARVTKKTGRALASGGAGGCDKKEHPFLKYRSASAARAERQRSGPTVIAVRRRRDKNAPEDPGFTTRQQNSPRAPHIYKYIAKSIIPHSIQNPRPRNLSL